MAHTSSQPCEPVRGIVTTRKCPHCGHQETGLVSGEGIFHPLLPGMRVQILQELPDAPATPSVLKGTVPPSDTQSVSRPPQMPWAPGPVSGNTALRLKYGVFLQPADSDGALDRFAYKAAYIEKLARLLAEEEHPVIAVLLDQYLKAAHLASGDPRETAEALWNELEEIREPAERVLSWLEDPNEATKKALCGETNCIAAPSPPLSTSDFASELEALTLEDFLASL